MPETATREDEPMGCSDFAAAMFSFDKTRIFGCPTLFLPSVDAYFSFRRSQLDSRGTAITVNGWSKDAVFLNHLKKLVAISSLVVVNAIEIESQLTDTLRELENMLREDYKAPLVVVIRNLKKADGEARNKFERKCGSRIHCYELADQQDEEHSERVASHVRQVVQKFWKEEYEPILAHSSELRVVMSARALELAQQFREFPQFSQMLREDNDLLAEFESLPGANLAPSYFPFTVHRGLARAASSSLAPKDANSYQHLLDFQAATLSPVAVKMWNMLHYRGLEELKTASNKLMADQERRRLEEVRKVTAIQTQMRDLETRVQEGRANALPLLQINTGAAKASYEQEIAAVNENQRQITEKQHLSETAYKNIAGFELSFDTAIEELLLAADHEASKTSAASKQLLQDFAPTLALRFLQGMEIQLLRGNPQYVGCVGLETVIEQINTLIQQQKHGMKRLSVVSIIGNYKSHKSTLLNYLSGADFPSSETVNSRGAAARLTHFGEGHYVLFLDTEGFQSNLSGDNAANFEKLLAVWCLFISQVVIYNHIGALSESVHNFLQTVLFAYHYLAPQRPDKPQLVFTLRDQENPDMMIHQHALSLLQNNLADALAIYDIKLSDLVQISAENLFCLPSAVSSRASNISTTCCSDINTSQLTTTFAEGVKRLRWKLRETLEAVHILFTFMDFNEFYNMANVSFETLYNYGTELTNFETVAKLKVRDSVRHVTMQVLKSAVVTDRWNTVVSDYNKAVEECTTIHDAKEALNKLEGELLEQVRGGILGPWKKALEAQKIVADLDITEEEEANMRVILERKRTTTLEAARATLERISNKLRFEADEKSFTDAVAVVRRDDKGALTQLKTRLLESRTRIQAASSEAALRSEVLARLSDEFMYALREEAAITHKLKRIQPLSENEVMGTNLDHADIAQHWVLPHRHLKPESMRGIGDIKARTKGRFTEAGVRLIAMFSKKDKIAETMLSFVQEVNNLCDQEMTSNKLGNFTFYETALKNGVYRLLLPEIFKKICTAEMQDQRNVIEGRLKQINNVLEKTDAMIRANNEQDYGKMLGIAAANGVRNDTLAQYTAVAIAKFKDGLPWRCPEALLKHIFDISFGQQDYLRVLKYMVDVELLMAEEARAKVKLELPKFYKESGTAIRDFILGKYKELIRQVQSAPNDIAGIEGLAKLLRETAELPEVREARNSLARVQIHDPLKCAQGIIAGIQQITVELTKKDKHSQSMVPEFAPPIIDKLVEDLCGCRERCLVCGAKCLQARDHPIDTPHKALHHLCAFAGKTYKWLQIPILEECKSVYNRYMYTAVGEVVNRQEYIDKNAHQWYEDMKNPKAITENPELLLRGWANSRLPFEHYRKISEFVTPKLKELEDPLRILPPLIDLPLYPMPTGGLHKVDIPELDIVFLLDCTDSMRDEIEGSIAAIESIVQQIRALCGINARVGFVGYRDHKPPPEILSKYTQPPIVAHRVITKHLTSKHDSIIRFINDNKQPVNGYDYAEAVADGLNEVLHLNWREHAHKLVFHILDAPPHGREYHDEHYLLSRPQIDWHLAGCPCGLRCPDILAGLAAQGISYLMISVRYAMHLRKTVEIFRQAYPRMYYLDLEATQSPEQHRDSSSYVLPNLDPTSVIDTAHNQEPMNPRTINSSDTIVGRRNAAAVSRSQHLADHMLNFLLSTDF